uniref:Large ribosomal subunit protein bL35c n=1 Tax=Dipterosiphonia australica TaxID=2007208 RepID=A0A1Z1ML75_9FLOR|nr:ribosomal protein L35 [Dipterosiphonia australica]ARW66847.1 ribosomal protein L35 [Dipterosiphonia australica]
MYKLKNSQSVCKRFKVTSSGNLLKRKAGKSHLLQKKNNKRKRKLRKVGVVNCHDKSNFINVLPYLN